MPLRCFLLLRGTTSLARVSFLKNSRVLILVIDLGISCFSSNASNSKSLRVSDLDMAPEQDPVAVEEVKNAEVAVKSEPEEENVDLKAEIAEDGEIDVVGFGDGADVYTVQGDDPDATEHSSSFGETFSGCGDGGNSSSSDAEVESRVEQHSLSNGVLRICRFFFFFLFFFFSICWFRVTNN